jgi:hypothetical protein
MVWATFLGIFLETKLVTLDGALIRSDLFYYFIFSNRRICETAAPLDLLWNVESICCCDGPSASFRRLKSIFCKFFFFAHSQKQCPEAVRCSYYCSAH